MSIVFDKCPKCDLKPLRAGVPVCPRCKFNIAAHAEKLSRSAGGPVSPDAVSAPFDMNAYLASMQAPIPGVGAGQVVAVGPGPGPGQINQVTPSDVAELVMQVNTAVFHMSGKLDVVVAGLAQVTSALAQVLAQLMAMYPPATAATPALTVVPPPTP